MAARRGAVARWGCALAVGTAGGDRLTTFKNELRGCGPFLHDDPGDRPPEVFGGRVTLHPGSYVLLPVVPEA